MNEHFDSFNVFVITIGIVAGLAILLSAVDADLQRNHDLRIKALEKGCTVVAVD